MSSWKHAFPSKYLKAEDLGATRPIVTIAAIDYEDVGTGQNKDNKLVIHWKGETLKPLVLNRINSETISEIVGSDEVEDWPGHEVQLFATKTDFQGKRVPCIRICAPPTTTTASPGKSRPVTGPSEPEPLGDETDVGF